MRVRVNYSMVELVEQRLRAERALQNMRFLQERYPEDPRLRGIVGRIEDAIHTIGAKMLDQAIREVELSS